MSATIDCEEIADYFAIPTQNGLNPACIFKVEGKPYAVEEYYLDDLKHVIHFQVWEIKFYIIGCSKKLE